MTMERCRVDDGKFCAYDFPFLLAILVPFKPKFLSQANLTYRYHHECEHKGWMNGGESTEVRRRGRYEFEGDMEWE
jgi:hypothetical protein